VAEWPEDFNIYFFFLSHFFGLVVLGLCRLVQKTFGLFISLPHLVIGFFAIGFLDLDFGGASFFVSDFLSLTIVLDSFFL
jgi:hypothetical protein